MINAIQGVLGIQTKDSGKLVALGPIFFLTGLAYVAGILSSQSLFVSKFGVRYLSLMYLVEAAILPFQLWMISYLSKKMPPGKMIRGLFLIILIATAIVALAAWGMIAFHITWRGFYPLLFIICSVMMRILVPLMWMLGNGICLLQQAKRLFPILGALFTLGATCAGFFGRIAPAFFTGSAAEAVLLVVPITLFFSLFLWRRIITVYFLTKDLESQEKPGASMKTVMSTVWRTPLLRLGLLGCVIMMSLYYIVDFQFFIFASRKFQASDDLTQFYGMFIATLYFITLLVNLFLNRLIKGIGIGKTIILIGIIAVVVLMGSGLMARGRWPLEAFSAADLIIDVLSFALLPMINEVLYKLVPAEQRAGISLLFAGSINAAGKLLSSLATGLYSTGLVPLIGLSIIGVSLAIWYLYLTMKQKRLYFSTLLSSLQNHIVCTPELESFAIGKKLGKSDLIPLQKALQSSESAKQLIALEFGAQMRNEALFPAIEPFLEHSDPRKRLLALQAIPENYFLLEELCLRALHDTDTEIRCEAVRQLKSHLRDGRLEEIFGPLISDSSPIVVREAIMALYQNAELNPDLKKQIDNQIQGMLSGDDENRFQICQGIRDVKASEYSELIRDMVDQEISPRVRVAAVKCLGRLGCLESIPWLVENYTNADRELKTTIEGALLEMGVGAVDTLAKDLECGDIEGWYLRVTVLAGLDNERRFEEKLGHNCKAKLKSWYAAHEALLIMERAGMVELASLYRKRLAENYTMIIEACWKLLDLYCDPVVVKRLRQTFELANPADKRDQGVEILNELSHKYPFAAEMANAIQGEFPALRQSLNFYDALKKTKQEYSDYWLDVFSDYAIAHYQGGGA